MKHYDWSLFMWHLVIEKTIKGIISQQDKSPLAIHNLTKLAKQANLELSKEHKKYLIEITGFNLASRYDNYKFSFYKKATKSFSTVWIKNCEEVYQELLNICNKN